MPEKFFATTRNKAARFFAWSCRRCWQRSRPRNRSLPALRPLRKKLPSDKIAGASFGCRVVRQRRRTFVLEFCCDVYAPGRDTMTELAIVTEKLTRRFGS